MNIKFRNLYADEIDIRVGQTLNTPNFQGVSLLLYKDARVDMTLLDEAVGEYNWQRSHSRDNANCTVSIWDSEKQQWVSKEDTGTESNTEAEKGKCSDSFKRACVNWGIGRSLYSAPKITIKCDLEQDKKGNYKPAKGIAWRVKEIEYMENNVISRLVIMETKYDKDTQVVFDWALGKGATFIKKSESNKTKYVCSVCGKEITEDYCNKSIEYYGVALCSKTCLSEHKARQGK